MADLAQRAERSKLAKREAKAPVEQPEAKKRQSGQPVSFRLRDDHRAMLRRLQEEAQKQVSGRVYNVDVVVAALWLAEQRGIGELINALKESRFSTE